MPLLYSSVSIIILGSIGFMLFTLKRLFAYVRKFPLEESRYTLVFKFINIRTLAAMYIVAVLGTTFFSVVYVLSL